jgi:hypothetical protein
VRKDEDVTTIGRVRGLINCSKKNKRNLDGEYAPRTLWGSNKPFLQIIASTKYQINSQNNCSILRWRIGGRMDLDGTGMGRSAAIGRKGTTPSLSLPPLSLTYLYFLSWQKHDSIATIDINAPFAGRIAVTDQGGRGY